MTTPNPPEQPGQGGAPSWQPPQRWDPPASAPPPPPPPQWGPTPPPPGAPYPPPAYYAPSRPMNGMAIASMVLGIVWIYWIGSILALVFGYIAKRQIAERNETGAGMATAGIVLGWVGVGILAVILFFVTLAALGGPDTSFE